MADGREYTEQTPELQGHDRSPFRQLQQMGSIVRVEAVLGIRTVAMDCHGWPLVTGQGLDIAMPLDGSSGPNKKRYRWVCRQERDRWVWQLTDGIRCWQIETPPQEAGKEKMPRPEV